MTIANDANSSVRFEASSNGSRGSSRDETGASGARNAVDPGHPPVRQWLERSVVRATEALGQKYLARLAGVRGNLDQSLRAIPERMHRAARQAQLVLELLEDVRSGSYRDVRWYSVTVAAAALLYVVSPADIIPDVLPLVGSFDDIALIALAVRLLRRDLRAYCKFKGYPEEQYFDAPA